MLYVFELYEPVEKEQFLGVQFEHILKIVPQIETKNEPKITNFGLIRTLKNYYFLFFFNKLFHQILNKFENNLHCRNQFPGF